MSSDRQAGFDTRLIPALDRPRRRYAQSIRAISFALLFTLISGCSEPRYDTVRFGLATAAVTLDPRYATDAASYRLCRLIYQALVDFDDAFKPIPSLASWEQLGATHYRFHIKTGQRFHDNGVVSARDVAATYESILDPDSASPHRSSLANIASIEAASSDVVDFHLHKPDPLFPGLLVLGILPAEDTTSLRDAQWVPNGSGPFVVSAPPLDGLVSLQRRADGQRFEFVTVRDATVRALKLVSGELDIVQGGLSPEHINWLSEQAHVNITTRPGTTFTYLGFNLLDPQMQKAEIRRAVAHAIDRAQIIEHIFRGRTRPADAILPPDHWAGHPELKGFDYDPASARETLEKAGFNRDHPLHLTYKTSSDHFRIRLATVIQHQLAGVGIDVKIQSYDWGTFYADVKAGRFQVYSLSWVGLKLPDIFRYAFHSKSVPPGGANRGRYHNDEIDRMIEAAEASDNLTARARIYRTIQETLLQDLPYIPLWYEDNVVVTRDDISGYDTTADGNYDALAHVMRETDG